MLFVCTIFLPFFVIFGPNGVPMYQFLHIFLFFGPNGVPMYQIFPMPEGIFLDPIAARKKKKIEMGKIAVIGIA